MDSFGVQDIAGAFAGREKESEKYPDIIAVLRKFQNGYKNRDTENVDAFVNDLFIPGDKPYALGTGTGELFFGVEQLKTLFTTDWENWGDVAIDPENASIVVDGGVAWFVTVGSIKQKFDDSHDKYSRYIKFIREKAENTELTPRQRITFINWVLALTFHQRSGEKRQYLSPLHLSGVLVKDNETWKIAFLHFSQPRANFPDERFENSAQHPENYAAQNALVPAYKNNEMTAGIQELLKKFENDFFRSGEISNDRIDRYFASDSRALVIGPDNQWYQGIDRIRGYFTKCDDSTISLDLEHAIASRSGAIAWVTVTGTLQQELQEDVLMERALNDVANLSESGLTVQEKIFAMKRSIAYVLKEFANGILYTCPFRMTSVVINHEDGPVFHTLHISYPAYWIFEGKLNGIEENTKSGN